MSRSGLLARAMAYTLKAKKLGLPKIGPHPSPVEAFRRKDSIPHLGNPIDLTLFVGHR